MATAYVKEVKHLTIKTDKGNIIMPVSYISENVVVGEQLTVTHMDANRTIPWKPYADIMSVLAVHSTPFRATEFTTKYNNLTGTIINESTNRYKLTLSQNGEQIRLYDNTIPTNTILIPDFVFVVGTNNVPYAPLAFDEGTASKYDPDTYIAPSNYGFGEATRKDFEGSFSDVVSDNGVKIATSLLNIGTFDKITDPYNKGDSTTAGGGGGTFGGGNTIFGGESDSIDIPPLPTASASSAGFITLFNPSLTQLNNLANYMWSDLFSIETFKKIFADPMDCILGLSIVPVKPASAGISTVKIGNVSTDVSMNKTSSQYVTVDCGTIDVKEYWGAYLDYAPYTQCEIYLPYVGTKQISVDDVMNKSVRVVYHVDILSGACNAYVKCGDSVLYTFVGQCSSSIPISGNDWTNVLNGAISVAGKIGLSMATGGATALMSGLGAASSIISSSKPTVERSGAMSSTGGLLGIQKPYLILIRPKQALPENQNKYTGYPSFITMALSDCTGYTEIDSIHLENMTCTDEEAQEIENLLKSGVIF